MQLLTRTPKGFAWNCDAHKVPIGGREYKFNVQRKRQAREAGGGGRSEELSMSYEPGSSAPHRVIHCAQATQLSAEFWSCTLSRSSESRWTEAASQDGWR